MNRAADDLISRTVLIDELMAGCMPLDLPGLSGVTGDELTIRDYIDSVPSVDVAPVVHARWIETTIPANTTGHGGVGQDKKNGRLCSNCRCAFDAVLLWCDSFCPNCGAKMESWHDMSKSNEKTIKH